MAERIPIVLSLSNSKSEQTELSDEVVLSAVFSQSGWDANIIAALSDVQPGSTDELCLSGLSGTFVLLTPYKFDVAARHLERLQILGTIRCLFGQHQSVPLGHSPRSIYVHQLTDKQSFERAIARIGQIQSDLQTAVIPISLPITSKGNGQPSPQSNHYLPSTAASKPSPLPESPSPPLHQSKNHSHLDDLLDALDTSDI